MTLHVITHARRRSTCRRRPGSAWRPHVAAVVIIISIMISSSSSSMSMGLITNIIISPGSAWRPHDVVAAVE